MRRLLYVLLCIFVAAGNCVYAQKDTLHVFNKKAYDRYSVIADSIVRLYYMDAMLPFISKDSARSYYRTLKTPGEALRANLTSRCLLSRKCFASGIILNTHRLKGIRWK